MNNRVRGVCGGCEKLALPVDDISAPDRFGRFAGADGKQVSRVHLEEIDRLG